MEEQFQDQVFKDKMSSATDFSFNEKVASVFDDMVTRSVPFYAEMQRMVGELAAAHAQPGSVVFDLGCSTGTTLLIMDKYIAGDIPFVGVDDSAEMISKCRQKLSGFNLYRPIELRIADLTVEGAVNNASVITMVLVLQFIRPPHRLNLIKKLYQGLNEDGIVIIVEKILTEEKSFNREFIKHYYDFKRRNSYSDLEISQKREALENVLIPYKTSENINLLKDAGFREAEVFFRWYNFTGIIAKK